jgi:hypothetical protein
MDDASRRAEGKLQSWRWVIEALERDTQDPRLRCLKPILRLAKQIATTDRATEFLAGLQLVDLIISTSRDYDEEFCDAYVRVGVARRGLEVTYCYPATLTEEQHQCAKEDLQATVDLLLDRLAHETREGALIERT